MTNSRPPRESAAQPGRAQECWSPGLAVTTASCFPRGCPSKVLVGDYSAEISPVMRISHWSSWQSWIAPDLWCSVKIFSNSSFETPLPPSVLPFESISHFYLMGCFCVCFVSCKFHQLNFVDSFITHILCANKCSLHKEKTTNQHNFVFLSKQASSEFYPKQSSLITKSNIN